MTSELMLAIGVICILSVFINGIMLAVCLQKHVEMIKLYRGVINLVKQSKIMQMGRRR